MEAVGWGGVGWGGGGQGSGKAAGWSPRAKRCPCRSLRAGLHPHTPWSLEVTPRLVRSSARCADCAVWTEGRDGGEERWTNHRGEATLF